MKLTNIRSRGRRINPETGRAVNVYIGRKKGYGVDVLYFLRSGNRVFIPDSEFSKWKESI